MTSGNVYMRAPLVPQELFVQTSILRKLDLDGHGWTWGTCVTKYTYTEKNWYLIIFRNKLYTCLHSPPTTSKELMSRAAIYHWCSMYFRVIRISFQHIWQVPSSQPLFPYPSPRNLPRVSSGSSHLHHHQHHHHQWFKGTFRKPHSIGKKQNKQNIWFQVTILPRTIHWHPHPRSGWTIGPKISWATKNIPIPSHEILLDRFPYGLAHTPNHSGSIVS